MHELEPTSQNSVALIVRRTIRAPLARVFEAWMAPDDLFRWWGPQGVRCVGAEVDLRPGGRYRIGNALPTGAVVWIAGAFEVIAPPHRLVYTWGFEHTGRCDERVTVRFEPRDGATEVIIVHEWIPEAERPGHAQGWEGCLDGLVAMLEGSA